MVPPHAGSGGRLRRDRVRLYAAGRRQAHLRAVDPDAQPGQRQRRRHRGLRLGAGRAGRVPPGARRGLHPASGAARSPVPPGGGRRVPDSVFRRRPRRHGPHGGRLPRRAAAGSPSPGRGPLLRPRQTQRAGSLCRRKGACQGGSVRTGHRRRIRLSELDQAEQPVLCFAGRQAGFRHVARAEHGDPQDRGVRRGRGAVLPHARRAGPRVDRSPALSDQGSRLASRRCASVHRTQRSPGPQRRFRQLSVRVGVPGRTQYLPAVPDRYRGLGPAVRSLEPGLSLSDRVHYRSPRADDRTGLRPAAQRQAADLPPDPGGSHPCLAGRTVVLHHRPQSGRDQGVSTPGHYRHRHAPPAGVCAAGRRGVHRADLLGKAGDRRYLGQPGQRRPAFHARGRHVLERPRRQLHRRRRVFVDGVATEWTRRRTRRAGPTCRSRRNVFQ